MRPMKVAGLTEIESALARIRKVHALGRVSSRDKLAVELHLEQALKRVRSMEEKDEEGQVIRNGHEASDS